MQNVNRFSVYSVHVQLIPSETRFSCRFLLIGQLVHLIIYFVCVLIAPSSLHCKNGAAYVAQDYSEPPKALCREV
jgi:succinate dehydrogenase hydrophobic anchor subunit